MKLKLERFYENNSVVKGILSTENGQFKCYTLELNRDLICDTRNANRIKMKTSAVFAGVISPFFRIMMPRAKFDLYTTFEEMRTKVIYIGSEFPDDFSINKNFDVAKSLSELIKIEPMFWMKTHELEIWMANDYRYEDKDYYDEREKVIQQANFDFT
ncbi:MAG: hypothetical protein KBT27_06945 [Prevotellaceae bacterium]|nr:hypothetical protein [Candidatus Faecinaster equi]